MATLALPTHSTITYRFGEHPIRVVPKDGDPWFVAADVCAALGIQNASQALQPLDDDEKGICSTYTLGGDQKVTAVSEGGLYSLVLRCRGATTPGTTAHRFRKWVTAEILPSIRRTGSYGGGDPMEALNDPTTLRQLLLGYSEKVEALEAENAAMAPKVAALDRIATADGSLCITDAAKHLQMRPGDLFRWMQAEGWIYKRAGSPTFIGYQTKVQQGLLEHKVNMVSRSDGSEKTVEQVRVTPKGLTALAGLFAPAAGSG